MLFAFVSLMISWGCSQGVDFIGYHYDHIHLVGKNNHTDKKGDLHGVVFGYTHQISGGYHFFLDARFSKGSLRGHDYNKRLDRWHFLEGRAKMRLGYGTKLSSVHIVPYLGLGGLVQSELPTGVVDYCATVYALTLPYGVYSYWDMNSQWQLGVDISSEWKLTGRWFIFGHPLFTTDASSLSYRSVFQAHIESRYHIALHHRLGLRGGYRTYQLFRKHPQPIFEPQKATHWFLTFLYSYLY